MVSDAQKAQVKKEENSGNDYQGNVVKMGETGSAPTNFSQGQNGKFTYDVTNDDGSISSYGIEFQLEVKVITSKGDDETLAMAALTAASKDPIGNSYIEKEGTTGADRGTLEHGEFAFVNPFKKIRTTGMHEIGHSLGIGKHIGYFKNIMASAVLACFSRLVYAIHDRRRLEQLLGSTFYLYPVAPSVTRTVYLQAFYSTTCRNDNANTASNANL